MTATTLERAQLARLVAEDIPAGSYVNLGIGQPTTVADHLPVSSGVILHTENGMLGMGPAAVGDEMDLATGAKAVFVMMDLFTRDGSAKLVPECTYPLTGLACVTRVYTPQAVLLLEDGRVRVRETFGFTLDELGARVPGIQLDG